MLTPVRAIASRWINAVGRRTAPVGFASPSKICHDRNLGCSVAPNASLGAQCASHSRCSVRSRSSAVPSPTSGRGRVPVCLGRWLIFIPDRSQGERPCRFGVAFEELWIDVARDSASGFVQRIGTVGGCPRGHRCAGDPAPARERPRARRNGRAPARLARMGYAVLVIDYRGFGRSDGDSPSERTLYEDAGAPGPRCARLARDPRKRQVYGDSLGGAVAIELAHAKDDVSGMIVESSFTSMAELIRWNELMRWLSRRLDRSRALRFRLQARRDPLAHPLPARRSGRIHARLHE